MIPCRYKHHCGSDGVWDIEPGTKSCNIIAPLVECLNPTDIWKHWSWDCDDSLYPGSSCDGICNFDEEFQLAIECSEDGSWVVNQN